MLLLTFLLALAGCQCHDSADVREVTEVTTACLTKEGQVRAGFGGCLSSSCDTLLRASCEATVEGTNVVVRGSAAIQHVGEDCTKDCKSAVATCGGAPIADPTGLAINATKTPKLVRCWDLK